LPGLIVGGMVHRRPGIAERVVGMRMMRRRQVRVGLPLLGVVMLPGRPLMVWRIAVFFALGMGEFVLCLGGYGTHAADDFTFFRM